MASDNRELAQYLHKEIQKLQWRSRGELFKELTPNAISFWIGQFNCRDMIGHSEWSERYQRNIWVKENERDTKE